MKPIEKHDLPCPFCGHEAHCYCYQEHPEKPIYVSCSNCDCDKNWIGDEPTLECLDKLDEIATAYTKE